MHAAHLTGVINADTRQWVVDKALDKLKDLDFDTIVGCGVSGVSMAAILAHLLKKPLTVVRKAQDTDNHSSFRVEFTSEYVGRCRYLVVDDTIASGRTLWHIERSMTSTLPYSRLMGVWLYFDEVLHQNEIRDVGIIQDGGYEVEKVRIWS